MGGGTKGSCECMSRQVEAKTDRRKRMNIQQQPFIWVVVKIMVYTRDPKRDHYFDNYSYSEARQEVEYI